MTDRKKPDELEGLDWDEALAEWEEKSFAPEVARDVVTDKPANLGGSPAQRPLYRPTGAPAAAPPTAPSLPTSAPRSPFDDDEDGDGDTIIAMVPEEILRRHRPGGSTSSRGGLSQMFARETPPDTPPASGSGRASSDVSDVMTSAPSVPSNAASAPSVPSNAASAPSVPSNLEPARWNEDETFIRKAPSIPPTMEVAAARVAAAQSDRPVPAWSDERPADAWLDGAGRTSVEERARWLEEEARALADKTDCARGLLACSELWAIAGERGRAHALAAEARELAPSMALAHRQARALMPWPPDPDDYVDSLDEEVRTGPTDQARVHSALLAAEALRARGDEEGASERLGEAAAMGSADVRAAVLRATRALAHDETTGASLRISDSAELAPVARAIATVLRLRGIEAPASPSGEPTESGGAETSPNEAVLRARLELGQGHLAAAASTLAELARVPELASAAMWLAAALASTTRQGRRVAVRLLRQLIEGGDDAAHAPLAARAIELGDESLLADAVATVSPLTPADRVVLAVLAQAPLSASDERIDAAADMHPGMLPLVSAAAAVAAPDPARYPRTAGSLQSRTEVALGRRLAARAPDDELARSHGTLLDDTPAARGVALELSTRAGRTGDISRTVETWGVARFAADGRSIGAMAGALVAERAGEIARAGEAFASAREADPTCEAALRALASSEPIDQALELNAFADELGGGLRSALARIEAVVRGGDTLAVDTQTQWLELAHRAAPALPIAAFLAERIARRGGNADEVLRWVRERRHATVDGIEGAIESVREAFLIADSDPDLAAERLRAAHAASPRDAALRELYERMASDPPDDSASWREQRAVEATGDARLLLALEAAHGFERVRQEEAALRCATVAVEGNTSLGRVARERAELRTGRVARLADELMTVAKVAPDAGSRREAYERLAILDATARHDAASALLWHRSVLETFPEHKPSLRHVEHHLIAGGRAEELEPIAASIARALRGGGPGEGTAHAELAARLRIRADVNGSAAAREMLDIATGEGEASLWALRMLNALARAQGDDAAFLEATKRIVDRASRPSEIAALLVRAGEAAIRIDRSDEARRLVERASTQDPGDMLAWNLLALLRDGSGDVRGAAEATESLARCSAVPEHQLLAWYDAGRLWMDHAGDEERAVRALETAAIIDLAHADIFDRLARLYASRGMQAELADLLQRRLDGVTDAEERLAIEVRRGRVLLEVGEIAGARKAFEAALHERPDDPTALSAFAEICIVNGDWEAAEQALVRLARLLPTAQEQRGVYGRLGDLYSHHLVNLSRAEVAFKEVLKRAPDDADTARKLVDVYKRQSNAAGAVALQQDLARRAASPEDKRERVLELASIYEHLALDLRQAEKTLDGARRDSPQDVAFLRALAEFYVRHQQTPAVNILLDRAAAAARRALASGRMAREPFEIVAAVFDIRGQPDAARATLATFDAIAGQPTSTPGAWERALDPQFDDDLAPDVLTPAIRSLLAKTGDALDAAAPVDLRELRASPAADSPLARLAHRAGAAIGLGSLNVLSSPKLGAVCIPVGPAPTIVMGESLVDSDRVGAFMVLRALKLLRAKAAILGRMSAGELGVILPAWLKAINPTWEPRGLPASELAAAVTVIAAALPRNAEPDVGFLALEAAGAVDERPDALGAAALAWANRVALLAVGDPNVALDALARLGGLVDGAPRDVRERSAWVSRTPEARDLLVFGISDAFAQARSRLGLAG
jgi:tetratricopeptide (TPR) repeat protein